MTRLRTLILMVVVASALASLLVPGVAADIRELWEWLVLQLHTL
jgi:hypothetical protein